MIELKPFREEDFEALISWVGSEELLVQFAGPIFKYPLTVAQLEKYISDENRYVFKVINPEANGIAIGHAEIFLVTPTAARLCRILIGDKSYRGKGVGQEIIKQLIDQSFEYLNAETIELNVYDWNTSAIKCYEKVGFEVNPNTINTTEVNGVTWTAINMVFPKPKKRAHSSSISK